MSTSARRCAGCGGPLPETPPSQRQITCPFCAIVNDLTHAAPEPPHVTINVDVDAMGRAATGVVRKIKIAVILGVVIVAIGVAVSIWTAVTPMTNAINAVAKQSTQMEERLRAIEPVELATPAQQQLGWREVKTAPPIGEWRAFDPVANLDWAMTIAKAWQADATLTRIDVNKVTPAGVVNVSNGAEDTAGYRFTSPAQIAAWAKIADRETNAQVPYELMLRIADKKVTALVSRGRPSSRELPTAPVETRALRELISTAIKSGKFAEYPYYNGYMIQLEREGWVWYLQSLSRRESLPRIRARDGQPYPYR